MKKIIVNSLTLCVLLSEFLDWNNAEDIPVTVHKNGDLQFGFYERTLNVETQGDWTIETSIRQIERLAKMLSCIEEQPVTILFQDNNRWINISGIVI